MARYGEWGGFNTNDTWGFDTRRPGWAMPIQSLLLSNGVNAVFHGHDHLFVKQELDANGDGVTDLIYQECPQPSATNYSNTGTAARLHLHERRHPGQRRPSARHGDPHQRHGRVRPRVSAGP